MVKRYDIHSTPCVGTEDDPCHEMFECSDGEYVSAIDYEGMSKSRDAHLREANRIAMQLDGLLDSICFVNGLLDRRLFSEAIDRIREMGTNRAGQSRAKTWSTQDE